MIYYITCLQWGGLHDCDGPRTWSAKWLGSPRFIFTADPRVIQHVLRDNFDNYVKGPMVYSNLASLLGHGIFTSDGAQWKAQRRAASHMFSLRQFRETIMTAFLRHAPELTAILDEAAAQPPPASKGSSRALSSNGEVEVDMQSLYFRFTLDSIGDIAFGDSIGSLRDAELPFSKAFDLAQSIVEHRFLSPLWQVTELFDGSRRQLNDSVAVLNDYAFDLIKRRRNAGDYDSRGDVLSRFMAMKDDDTGQPLYLHDDAYLRDVVMNLMIAGRDTTAQALSWATLLLTMQPQASLKLRAEADALFGSPQPTSISSAGSTLPPLRSDGVTYDAVERGLIYTQAVVLETLRLYPSVPKDLKQAVADDVLPDSAGTVIRRGDIIAWAPFATGRSQAVWGADAGEFKPERMIHPDGSLAKPSAFKFPSFNAGPRTCLGQQMALVEASFVLALLLHRYDIRLAPDAAAQVQGWIAATSTTAQQGSSPAAAADDDGNDGDDSMAVPVTPVPYLESLTLPMKHGLRCILQPRATAGVHA